MTRKVYIPAAIDPGSVSLEVNSHVFIRDEKLIWLPAKIISVNSTHAYVAVEPSFLQNKSVSYRKLNILNTKATNKKKIKLKDYPPLYKLPLQNVTVENGVENTDASLDFIRNIEDMKDLEFYSEASVLYNRAVFRCFPHSGLMICTRMKRD